MEFSYKSFPAQVHFGKGKIAVLPELLKGFSSVLLIAEGRFAPQAERFAAAFGNEKVVLFSNVIQHVPQRIVDEAYEVVKKENPDVLLSIGGGSSVGLAKALALQTELPIIAVPTTYAGSEQTNIWGISTEAGKTTGRSAKVLPKVVVYDPELTQSMPPVLAAKSAMNAMAHLMEAVYAPDGNPFTSHYAKLGMKSLKEGLLKLAEEKGLSEQTNEKILFGAYLGGKSLCEVSMSLHHKAAHVLGGSFGMEHATVHTVLQSYVLAYQWPYLSAGTQADFKEVFGEKPAIALRELADKNNIASDLKSIGFIEEDIPEAAALLLKKPYANPAPLNENGLEQLLRNAWAGKL